jgi:hypothetical protein
LSSPQQDASSPTDPWWLGRPSAKAALVSTAACLALAAGIGWLAAQQSPLVVRNLLPTPSAEAREVFLTHLIDQPQRVLFTSQRSLTSVHRGEDAQGGSSYWIHRYGDPARPELPDRILLQSRSRGARLLVPVGALELGSALASPVGIEPAKEGGGGSVPSRLVHLYVDRLFAGTYLELRFPDRERDENGEPRRFDLIAIRDNRVRTADFVLAPNPRYYRAALIEGDVPHGDLVASELPGAPELVFAFYEDLARGAESLQVPISLFDELELAWGDAMPMLVDDRWQIDELPRYETAPASPEIREATAQMVALHLAARFESRSERERLAHEMGEWLAR